LVRLLVDESTGAAVVAYLRSAGHDVVAVAEAMPQADDSDILTRAASERRVLLTNDKDFGALVFRDSRAHSGVVLLRLEDGTPGNRVRIVRAIVEQYADRLAGRFTVATDKGVRIGDLNIAP
jgi:predicted nuclease of predicted toxin-antitoxin system